MMSRAGLSSLVVAVAAIAIAHAAESLQIVPIVDGRHVLVSFELADAYTNDVHDAIASGLRTTFTYEVELHMRVPAWVDRTVATAVVSVSDQYDNLTQRHHLLRTIDGRVEDDTVTEDEAVARRWLTSLTREPLCDTSGLDPSRDYYVRIRARMPDRTSWLGWAHTITGQVRFTFVP